MNIAMSLKTVRQQKSPSHLNSHSLRHLGWGTLSKLCGLRLEPIIFVLRLYISITIGRVEGIGFYLKAGGGGEKGGGVATPRIE
jgi:hypothetical protein